MSETASAFDLFREQLDSLVNSCQQNREQRIACGNLRHEYCQVTGADGDDRGVAIIYEVPGGSTTQINVNYHADTGEFSFLAEDLHGTVRCQAPQEALAYVQRHVQQIAGRRLRRLEQMVDDWIEQGMERGEVLLALNALLHDAMVGGRVTPNELKQGLQYAIKRTSQDSWH